MKYRYKNLIPIVLVILMAAAWYKLIDTTVNTQKQYDGYLTAARQYAKDGVIIDAITNYDNAINIKDDISVRKEVADLYFNNNRTDEGFDYVETVLSTYPKNVSAYEYAITKYKESNMYSQCFSVYSKAKNYGAVNQTIDKLMEDIQYSYKVQMLVDTPCKADVLKRAFLFSILTGLRHSDIQTLKWKQIQQTSKGTWQAVIVQQKTKRPDYKPVIQQALQLCGERPNDEESLVFEGLTDASWISRPLKVWIEASGIKKHITFHCGRHSFASLLLENGVDIYTIKDLMGHTNVRTTQIYTHIVNEQKEKAANTLHIDNLNL